MENDCTGCRVYTRVMATTPTDDPLADSDRTVGVNWELDSRNILKSLKREALLFDQIGIPWLDYWLLSLRRRGADASLFNELDWLRDISVVWELNLVQQADYFLNEDRPPVLRQYLGVIVAETGKPIDVITIPDQALRSEGIVAKSGSREADQDLIA